MVRGGCGYGEAKGLQKHMRMWWREARKASSGVAGMYANWERQESSFRAGRDGDTESRETSLQAQAEIMSAFNSSRGRGI